MNTQKKHSKFHQQLRLKALEIIEEELVKQNYSQSKAAERLGISRGTLRSVLKDNEVRIRKVESFKELVANELE